MDEINVLEGNDIGISINDQLVGCKNSGSINVDREMKDVKCFAAGKWKVQKAGQISWGAELGAVSRVFPDATDAAEVGFHNALDLLVVGDLVTITFKAYQTGSVGRQYTGQANITSVKFDAGDDSTWSVSFVGNGPLTYTNLPATA